MREDASTGSALLLWQAQRSKAAQLTPRRARLARRLPRMVLELAHRAARANPRARIRVVRARRAGCRCGGPKAAVGARWARDAIIHAAHHGEGRIHVGACWAWAWRWGARSAIVAQRANEACGRIRLWLVLAGWAGGALGCSKLIRVSARSALAAIRCRHGASAGVRATWWTQRALGGIEQAGRGAVRAGRAGLPDHGRHGSRLGAVAAERACTARCLHDGL